ncbi:MAG TPA: hypothetical protein DDZ51_15260 [Planctomycetaceae bacterium]|nr:hypothetical protein [Planctomycetaceae bacterium]
MLANGSSKSKNWASVEAASLATGMRFGIRLDLINTDLTGHDPSLPRSSDDHHQTPNASPPIRVRPPPAAGETRQWQTHDLVIWF